MGANEKPERCGCLCEVWEHEPSVCLEQADTYQTFGVMRPYPVSLCTPCKEAIAAYRGRVFTASKTR